MNKKPLHSQYALRNNDPVVDKQKNHRKLKNAGLKSDTEAFILVVQGKRLFIMNDHATQ